MLFINVHCNAVEEKCNLGGKRSQQFETFILAIR